MYLRSRFKECYFIFFCFDIGWYIPSRTLAVFIPTYLCLASLNPIRFCGAES